MTPSNTPTTGPHIFEMEHWISCAPFEKMLGIDIERAENGRAELTMPFMKDLAQGGGLMHGGALVSLADTAMVMAIKTLVSPQTHFATISLETRFFHPVKKGMVTATAKITEKTGRILKGRASVCDEKNREVMAFLATFKIAKDAKIRDIVIQG